MYTLVSNADLEGKGDVHTSVKCGSSGEGYPGSPPF